ncbi:MAG: RluA family pseudouridine synthase [Treponema sp.]|nr:RluA family pseudouridine synthase [Treponema sp.]
MTAASDDDGRRLDRILRKALPDLPLSAIHRLLRQNAVLVDGKPEGASFRVRAGQTININSIGHTDSESYIQNHNLKEKAAPKTSLEILYEGEGLLIVNKPSGIPVHGGKHGCESLESIVRTYLKPKIPASLSFKPGPLHRLDMNSSGIIVFSTNLEGARQFSLYMQNHKIKKQYLALVEGSIKKAGIWQDELRRDPESKMTFTSLPDSKSTKTALTRVTPLQGNKEYTLILAEIETGRTHQIRSQAAARGHPLAGDRKYGGKPIGKPFPKTGGFLLHAFRMELPPPFPPLIEAPLPEEFEVTIFELYGKTILDS